MKPIIAILICLSVLTQLHAQEPLSNSWYKCMTGKIDKSPITMYLHKAGNKVFGYYYYDNIVQPFSLRGIMDGSKIKLEGFQGIMEKNIFKGIYSAKGNKQEPFILMETSDQLLNIFDFISITGEKPLKTNSGKEINFFAGSIWPKSTVEPSVQFYLRRFIAEQFNIKKSEESINNILQSEKDIFYDPRKKEESSNGNADEREVLVVYQDEKLISVASIAHIYTAVTREYYSINYAVADLVHKSPLSLIDILGTEGTDKLPPLLEKYFRIKYTVDPAKTLKSARLLENEIQPNDNFYVTAKGICFCYQPGELTINSSDHIEIFIPFKELTQYLTPAITTLLK